MKYIVLTLIARLLFQLSFCQTSKTYKWWNPAKSTFPVIGGQGWHSGWANPYNRLLLKAEKYVRG